METKTKKIIVITLLSILAIVVIVILGLYIGNSTARSWIDKNILISF